MSLLAKLKELADRLLGEDQRAKHYVGVDWPRLIRSGDRLHRRSFWQLCCEPPCPIL